MQIYFKENMFNHLDSSDYLSLAWHNESLYSITRYNTMLRGSLWWRHHFPRYWPMRGVNTGHRWVPLHWHAGDLRRHRAHYDVTVMCYGRILSKLWTHKIHIRRIPCPRGRLVECLLWFIIIINYCYYYYYYYYFYYYYYHHYRYHYLHYLYHHYQYHYYHYYYYNY